MRFRIHHTLFAAFLAVVATLLLVTVIVARSSLRDDLLRLTHAELERELELIGGRLGDLPPAEPDSLARSLTARIDHRVTIIDTSGVVLGDSDVPAGRVPEMENQRNRPEVEGALEGGVEFAQRTSATLDRPFVYGARRVELGGRPVVLRLAASMEEIETTLGHFQRSVTGAGLLAMLVALGLAWLLSRSFARPVAALGDRARRLADGELEARAPRQSRLVELDELAVSFNRLAEELETRLGELSRERDQMQTLIDTMADGVLALTDDARVLRTNDAARELLELPEPVLYAPVGSLVRHPELRELLESAVVRSFQSREISLGERELIVQSRLLEGGGAVVTFLDVTELRRMEQVRRDFVANASHELKTPLTSIRGFSETLLDDDPPPELRTRFLTSIRDNAIRLQRLVDDLLDLSRLESGGWTAGSERVELVPAVRTVWRELVARVQDKELDFEVTGEGAVWADPRGLQQVLKNLLENSIQYTPDGGRVSVRIQRGDGEVEMAVSDTGIGIPSAALPRIFERFYRADPARSREAGGTGLGLAIVKHVVDAMDGRVEAESRLGEGTTVRVRLPEA